MDRELLKLKTIIGVQLNVPKNAVDKKTREAEYVRARILYANVLMNELDIPIGKMSNYMDRDRSSFYHYQKQHNNALDMPNFYKEYLDDYQRVVEMFLGNSDVVLKRWEMEFDELQTQQLQIKRRMEQMEKEMQEVANA